jgi:hypothetical protein
LLIFIFSWTVLDSELHCVQPIVILKNVCMEPVGTIEKISVGQVFFPR